MVVQRSGGESGFSPYDVLIVGGGIAGSALAIVLARNGLAVGVLERDLEPVDRVRGEYMAGWGVIELGKLGLLDLLKGSGGIFSRRNIPYDENMPGDQALPYTLRFSDVLPEIEGAFCMSHPAMCRSLANEAERQGVKFLRGVENVQIGTGQRPEVSFTFEGVRAEVKPRLVIGADGRNSTVRRQLAMTLLS
jgi:2-polyprenyl-6-methoxyphenol hydroxylase-like FAD-dependent oxidoreductase